MKTFKSGATSSDHRPTYQLMTWCSVKLTALRFMHGNQKHEENKTMLGDANWLKAFHDRDLDFYRDRWTHAIDHLMDESQGAVDDGPGGNIGGTGWFLEIAAYCRDYDPVFYQAVQGLRPHPGPREGECPCPRCRNTRDMQCGDKVTDPEKIIIDYVKTNVVFDVNPDSNVPKETASTTPRTDDRQWQGGNDSRRI